jgi:purine-binding chemotaxis protein CheW
MTPEDEQPGLAAALAEVRAASTEGLDVLRARANALARALRRAPSAEAERGTLQVLVFALGEERYAVDIEHVLWVGVLSELMPLPGARPPLHGLTEWHGDVVTVLDLRSLLGASVQGIADLGRLIVMAGPDRRFGVLVERLLDVVEVGAERLEPLPREDAREVSLLRGMTEDAVFLVDADALIRRYGTAAKAAHTNEEA